MSEATHVLETWGHLPPDTFVWLDEQGRPRPVVRWYEHDAGIEIHLFPREVVFVPRARRARDLESRPVVRRLRPWGVPKGRLLRGRS